MLRQLAGNGLVSKAALRVKIRDSEYLGLSIFSVPVLHGLSRLLVETPCRRTGFTLLFHCICTLVFRNFLYADIAPLDMAAQLTVLRTVLLLSDTWAARNYAGEDYRMHPSQLSALLDFVTPVLILIIMWPVFLRVSNPRS